MQPKDTKWSYSSLKTFENCARQYHELRVLHNYPREETEQTLYGTRLHKQAELYIRDNKPLDPDFLFMQPMLDSLVAWPGRKFTEHEMALRHDLSPCGFKDEDYWVRGIADLIVVDDDNLTARVVDFKSGGDKYPDTEQLTLMSLMVFKHFPHVRHVTSGLLFVLRGTVIKHKVAIEEQNKLWWKFREKVGDIAMAHATGTWNPRQSGLCKRFCPCTGCEYNGRN